MDLFNLQDKVAVVTGAAGVLCSSMAKELAARGAKVALLDLNEAKAKEFAAEINEAGGTAIGIGANVLDKDSLLADRDAVLQEFGRVDILINGAGGNKKEATADDTRSFFELPQDAMQWVFNLNFIGTVLPTQVFGECMVKQESGAVVNISSMAAFRPLTRTISYSTAKAAINNFTQWMAVHFNQNYSANIRVNAIAPGFFITEQNYYLMIDKETGEPTPRGEKVLEHTPMGRYGTPEDLIGTLIWLVSDASSFVNGAVIPVDGGFSAYSGV